MSILGVFDDSEQFFTATQMRMIDALLGEGDVSSRALQAWADVIDIDDIDAASYRLVPALYARAGSSPALRALHGRMKGIYRYYFYRNNKFLTRIETIFQALTAAGIDFLVFKGISILLQHHRGAASRSSADCDILVRPRDKLRAEAVLADCGLRYCYDAEHKLADLHSHDFTDGAGGGFDLHWYALLEHCEADTDSGFWGRSRRLAWKGMALRVLAPEDELLVAAINGIRDPRDARADWLYDAKLILKARPNFDWRLFNNELKRRRLAYSFVTAAGMLQRFVPNFPAKRVEKLFAAEIRQAAARQVAENRCFGLESGTDRELTAALAPASWFRRLVGPAEDWRGIAARSGGVGRHIRYDVYEDGSLSRIYLHRDLLKSVAEIFEVTDPAALDIGRNLSRREDEAQFDLPPGIVHVPEPAPKRDYAATVRTDARLLRFCSPEIGSLPIEVQITNDSTWPWHVCSGSNRSFGLGYHLLAQDGEMLDWDLPRRDFLIARRGQAAVLMQGESLRLALEILRPASPGAYRARLDIVHEQVAWFDPEGRVFPSLTIEVI